MRLPFLIGGLIAAGAMTWYLTRQRPTKVVTPSTPSAGFEGPFAFIGDSIGVGMAPHLTLPSLTSFAVVGYSTSRMLDVARRELTPGRFRTVIVEGHLNDHRLGADRTIPNLRATYQAARSSGARVVGVTSTEWAGYRNYTPSQGLQRDLVDEWIVSGGDGLLDLAVDLRDVRAEHAPDSLHFTRSGYQTLAREINRAIM
jgi:hypothetical protein